MSSSVGIRQVAASGGEAAIIACDGAAMGIGTDVGGSLRIPMAFCGIYGFKPTPGRTSAIGTSGMLFSSRYMFVINLSNFTHKNYLRDSKQ